MVVDLSLSYEGAKARIGKLIPILPIGACDYERSAAAFYKEIHESADASKFMFEHDANDLWDLQWTFDRNSELVKKNRRVIQVQADYPDVDRS